MLVLEGWWAGLSRVCRLRRRAVLKCHSRSGKGFGWGTSANGCHRRRAEGKNDVWCWGFIFDRTESGSPFKWLSVIDEYTRECLALKVDRGITSGDIIDTLAELFPMRGVPKHIRSENGPEFIANDRGAWFGWVGVSTPYIKPRNSWDNGYTENFNSRFRDECPALDVFQSLRDSRAITAAWRRRLQPPEASQLTRFADPGRDCRRVCEFRLGKGFGSSRTIGYRPNPTLNPRNPLVQEIEGGHHHLNLTPPELHRETPSSTAS